MYLRLRLVPSPAVSRADRASDIDFSFASHKRQAGAFQQMVSSLFATRTRGLEGYG